MNQFAVYPSLKGRRVFITGGASGIGAAMVEAFSQQGARVGFIDIDADAAGVLQKKLLANGVASSWFRVVDVTDVAALKAVVAEYAESHEGLEILVNNVANDMRQAPLDVTPEDWRQCLAVNLDSAFFGSQAAIPVMMRDGGGSIINFSSINALLGPTQMPAYVSAKAAMLGLTKSLAREFGPQDIRVNAILPGWVATERQLKTWLTEEAECEWMEQVPLKARIEPRDVANLALFLGADDSRMVTNQHFIVDGGRV